MNKHLSIFFVLVSWFSFSQKNRTDGIKFIQNQGQVTDFNSELRRDVLFSSNANGLNLFLRKGGISYLQSTFGKIEQEFHDQEKNHKLNSYQDKDQFERKLIEETIVSFHQVDVDFLNSNENIEVIVSDTCEDYINYYNIKNSDGFFNVPLYNKVQYKNVYEGVNIDFYGDQDGFEYDFIIAPYSDINQIQLLWKGVEDLTIMKDGKLKIKTSLSDIVESIPEAYQVINGKKIFIEVKYNLQFIEGSGQTIIRFDVGEDYDTSHALIIDPWVTYYGGFGTERGNDLYNDSLGNLYVVGVTSSSNAIATPGSFKTTISASTGFSQDAFIVKFTPAGSRVWATYYGGEEIDIFQSVTVDKNNFIYASGSTSSHTGIASISCYKDSLTPHPTSSYARDAFLVKFSPNGQRMWGTYYGGEQNETAFEIATDSQGNVYMIGNTSSLNGIATPGAFDTALAIAGPSFFGSDVFLVKFNPLGNLTWGTYFGGDGNENGYGIAVDDSNHIFICGNTTSQTDIATSGTHKSTFTGTSNDAFLVKFNANGTRVWGTYFGGASNDIGNSVAVDTNNDIYVSGRTTSVTSISTARSFQINPGGGLDAFLAKFNQTGARVWSTYYGGNRSDYSYSVAVNNRTNRVMMSGDTYSFDLPVSPCALQSSLRGLENGFVGQFYSDGSIYCSSYFGNNHEEDTKITTFDCNIYLTGYSPSGVSTTPGAHQTSSGGGTEAWIAQLYTNTCGVSTPIKSLSVTKTDNTKKCKPCNGSATVTVSSICLEDSLYTYTWSDGVSILNSTDTFNVRSDLCSGSYWVEVMIQNSCFVTRDTFYFMIKDTLLPTINFQSDSVCIGSSNKFNTTSTNLPFGTSYLWIFGDGDSAFLNNTQHTYTAPGNYLVTLVQQYGPSCFDTIIKNASVYDNPQASFSVVIENKEYFSDNLDSICTYLFQFVDFKDYSTSQGSFAITDYSWIFDSESYSSQQNPSYAFQGIRKYDITLNVMNEKGCKDSVKKQIKVCDDFNLNVPNSFTPNGDGVNDYFTHTGFGIDTEKYRFQIFNRWGELIFESTNLEGWDGKYKGERPPQPIYIWRIKYKQVNSNEMTEKNGHVFLQRKND